MKHLNVVILGFLFTLAAAWFFSWQSADIVWGLWISSLSVGYRKIIYRAVAVSKAARGLNIAAGIAAGCFFLLFFSLHFGIFHYVHSIFLEHFFPLPGRDGGNPANIFMTIYLSLSHYWPIVLGAFIADSSRPVETDDARKTSRLRNLEAAAHARMGDVYGSVVRMHLLIIAMAFLHAAHLERLGIVFVLLLFFFPFKELIENLRAGKK